MAAAADFMNEVLGRRPVAADWHPASSIGGTMVFGRDDDRARLYATLEVAPADCAVHLAEIGGIARTGAQFDIVTAGLDGVLAGDADSVVSDLLGLCSPGGRIGVARPTPGSFLAAIEALIGKYLYGPAERPSSLPGARAAMNDAFAPFAVAMGAVDRTILLSYEDVGHWLEEFTLGYEPLKRAWLRVSPAWRRQFRAALLETASAYARPARFGIVIPCEYLEFTLQTTPVR